MALLTNYTKYSVKTRLKTTVSETAISYSLKYSSGLDEYIDKYSIWYDSHYLSNFVSKYTFAYTSLYGDAVLNYRLRYTSGVELSERSTRYSLKYTANFTNVYNASYTIRYSTLSPTESSFRRIYKLKYSTQGSREYVNKYTVRFSLEFFKNRSAAYYIRYDSRTPFANNTNVVLLRSNDRTSALFCIRGASIESLKENIYVFSNLPRYQLVAMEAFENKANIVWLEVEDVRPHNLFLEDNDERGSLPPVAYLLVKDVDEVNNMSLDIYNSENLEKLNRSKSFFFDLDSNAFLMNLVNLDDELYSYVNYTSEYYNYTYLNFVERTLTPLFRLGDSCCFNVKINSTTTGGMCSPF